MKQVNLLGKSIKGKNRIREHGHVWEVHAETNTVLFNAEPGPWAFISPINKTMDDKNSRWVHLTSDKDFVVTYIKTG
jgi:hypothetical protein